MDEITPKELRDLYGMVTTIKDKVTRMEYMLNSDEKTNKKGAIEELSIVRNKLYEMEEKQKNFQYKIATQVGMLVSVFLVASWLIDKVYKYVIK
jgi:negative regulator of replication initiation